MPTEEMLQRIVPEETNKNPTPQGMYGQRIVEDVPVYDFAGSEKIISGNNNSFIVLGRDRHSSKASGASGRGFTQCGSIDLVAGLDSSNGPHKKKRNPNFFTDAARVYITQKGKVGDYFGISKGSELGDSKWRSGVGLKADQVIVHGSNHVKIVTGRARTRGEEKNSMGGSMESAGKIDLIAGNNTDDEESSPISMFGSPSTSFMKQVKTLQPAVKGENLADFIDELLETISDLQNQVFANKTAILQVATSTALHIHEICVPFAPSSPPLILAATLVPTITKTFVSLPESTLIEWNLSTMRENYLNPNFATYINSKNINLT